MNASELKGRVESTDGGRHFFTRDSMRFFGDTMKNYGVRFVIVQDIDGHLIEAWELFRRRPVKHGLKSSAFFRDVTFTRMYPPDDVKFYKKIDGKLMEEK